MTTVESPPQQQQHQPQQPPQPQQAQPQPKGRVLPPHLRLQAALQQREAAIAAAAAAAAPAAVSPPAAGAAAAQPAAAAAPAQPVIPNGYATFEVTNGEEYEMYVERNVEHTGENNVEVGKQPGGSGDKKKVQQDGENSGAGDTHTHTHTDRHMCPLVCSLATTTWVVDMSCAFIVRSTDADRVAGCPGAAVRTHVLMPVCVCICVSLCRQGE